MAAISGTALREISVAGSPRYAQAERGMLVAGQPFEVLGNDGQWWYVRSGTLQGFIDARYTRCAHDGAQPLWSTRVAMDALSMRDRPGLHSETLRLLEQDELLTVLGYRVAPAGDVWLYAARDGLAGYVTADRTCQLPPAVPTTQTERSFLRRVLLAARRSQRETGVPVSVTLAQGILESNWGLSEPSDANNLLHIRARRCVDGSYWWGSIANGYMLTATTEWRDGRAVVVEAAFRTYGSLCDGVRDHGLLLRSDPRFAAAFAFANEPLRFAAAVAAAGYTSDPYYADKLHMLIDTYRLAQYDR